MIAFLIGLLLVGLVAGALARALVPGRDPMSLGATVALGVVGSFVGGFLGDVLFRGDADDRGLHPAGLLGSIVGAIVVLVVYNAITRRDTARL